MPIEWKGAGGGAKGCWTCAKKRRTQHGKAWAKANPEKAREHERRRARKGKRREYKRELDRRKARWRQVQRVAQAATEVSRTWLALLPAPPPVERRLAPRCELSARPQQRLFVAGWCADCGQSFVLAPGARNAKPGTRFCSPLCGKRLYRRRRRALETGPVNRNAVFIRDKGHCQLCGGMTDINAAVPDDLAAVIDHVIPLAKGGSDTMDNVQTAHFRCNSLKRDLSMEEYQATYGRTRTSSEGSRAAAAV